MDLVSGLKGVVVQAHGELAAVEDRRQPRLQPVPPPVYLRKGESFCGLWKRISFAMTDFGDGVSSPSR